LKEKNLNLAQALQTCTRESMKGCLVVKATG